MYKIVGIYNRDKERTPKTVGRYPLRIKNRKKCK